MNEYEEVLSVLGSDSALGNALRHILIETKTISLPSRTMGGRHLWNNTASLNGWRIQQHKITGRIRILDPDDMRIASGMNTRMSMTLQRMAKFIRENRELEHTTPEKALEDIFAQRDKLKTLCEAGQISPDEFSRRMKPFAEKAKYLIKVPDYDEFETLSPGAEYVEGFIRRIRVLWESDSILVKIASVILLIPRLLMMIFSAPMTLGPYILSRRKLSPAVKYPAYVLSVVAGVCLWVGIMYLLKQRGNS